VGVGPGKKMVPLDWNIGLRLYAPCITVVHDHRHYRHSSLALCTAIVRSEKIPKPRRNLAWSRVGELGTRLWRAGQSESAVTLLQEAILKLELAGANTAAARHRLKLATLFRQLERLQDATSSLPKQENLPLVLLRYLFAEKARLELGTNRPDDATVTCRKLLSLWRTEPDATAERATVERATVESLLAMAYLEAGENAQAQALARKSSLVLGPWQHHENLGCLVTLTLAGGESGPLWTDSWVQKGLRQIQADPLLTFAEKARLLESEGNRLERHLRLEEAQRLHDASSEQWRNVSTESQPVNTFA